jgi:hypothetical protein
LTGKRCARKQLRPIYYNIPVPFDGTEENHEKPDIPVPFDGTEETHEKPDIPVPFDGTEENHEKPESGYPFSRPDLGTLDCDIR